MEQTTRLQRQETLIRRVNQLYHELTQASFDDQHRHRFAVEAPFWRAVARMVLDGAATEPSAEPAATRQRLVIDIACGTGFVSGLLGRYLGPADRLLAFDLGEAPLHNAGCRWATQTAHRLDRPHFIRTLADAEHLPLPPASVDLVGMNASLHHMARPLEVLREIDRILCPGGSFALGFEPNRAHFSSPALAGASRGLSRLAWYASPSQNWRRIRRFVRDDQTGTDSALGRNYDMNSSSNSPAAVAEIMNHRLLADGLLKSPLPASSLLDLVDPHARGGDDGGGLDPTRLLSEVMPGYEVLLMTSSDYLGELPRRWPLVREVVDAALRAVAPRRGSLFSWLLRKPIGKEGGRG